MEERESKLGGEISKVYDLFISLSLVSTFTTVFVNRKRKINQSPIIPVAKTYPTLQQKESLSLVCPGSVLSPSLNFVDIKNRQLPFKHQKNYDQRLQALSNIKVPFDF